MRTVFQAAITTPARRLARIRFVKDALYICIGVAMASVGLKGFLLPNHFLDGGAMGVSLLLHQFISQVELSVFIVLVNLPFILLGAKHISYTFAVKSAVAILGLSVAVHFVEIPPVTSDKLLISVFGGVFLGLGIGFSIRGGAVIDGTEVLAIQISKKSSLSVGDFIAIFNVLLFLVAAILVNVETAMYSMLTYVSASRTVDFVLNGVEEYIGVLIVSPLAEDIRNRIVEDVGRGVTIFKSEGGYGSTGKFSGERSVLFCVVTRLEVTKLVLEVQKIDPDAFVVQHSIRDTKGGMIKKRPLH